MDKLLANRAKSYAKGMCNAMLVSITAFKDKYQEKDGIEIFKLAILTRPGWHEIDNGRYQYKEFGILDFEDDENLRSVLRKIAYCELPIYLNSLTPLEQVKPIGIAIDVIDKYGK